MKARALSLCCLALILAFAIRALPLQAPPKTSASPGPWRTFAPYFRVDTGYVSTIIVRNRHVRVPATVTPILYTSRGAELRLPPVQIPANSVRAISLEDELRAAGQWTDTGALALEYQAANPTVVNAQLNVKNAALGIVFDFPFQPGVSRTPKASSAVTAPWWFREPNVSMHLALFNTSANPVVVHPSFILSGPARKAAAVTLAPHQFTEMDMHQLLTFVGAPSAQQGMLSLSFDGPERSVYPALLSFNEQNGYSLTTHFNAHEQHSDSAQPLYYLPSISVNQQDASMGFRNGLRFTPYAVLGNATGRAMSVALRADFDTMDGTGQQHADLPLAPLAPWETRVVDFSSYLKSGLLPSSTMDFTLRLSHPGMMGDLVFQVFSVDQTGNFVFGADARMTATFRDDFIFWSTQGNTDTMLSIHNTADEDLPVRVTIGFNDGQSSYRFPPTTVAAGTTFNLDLKQMLSRASQPDDKGNPIPASANFGTLRVEPADGQPLERILVVSSIYDPVAGTCGPNCKICNVASSFDLTADPLIGAVSTSQQVTATVTWDDGTTTDATLHAHFSSSNTGAISITNTPGTSGNGVASFSAVGTSTINGTFTFSGGDPNEPLPACPTFCPSDTVQNATPATAAASVQVSNTVVNPTTIGQSSAPTSATVTVTVFHQDVTQVPGNPSVQLQVGTFSTDPPNLSVTYTNATQTIDLSGAAGSVTKDVTVSAPSGSGNITISASLANPSSGITIVAPSPSSNGQTTLVTTTGVPLQVTTTSLPNATLNAAYSQALSATGGQQPYAWSISAGALPPGLQLTTATGAIAGTPTQSGTFSFVATVTDSSTKRQSATKSLSISVP